MHSAVTENMIESVDMERGEAGSDEEFQKIDYRTYQSQYLKYLPFGMSCKPRVYFSFQKLNRLKGSYFSSLYSMHRKVDKIHKQEILAVLLSTVYHLL